VLARASRLGHEDDAPAPARAYRGTTSLAAGVRAVSGTSPGDRSSAGCDGPDPPGSSRALVRPFFRGLPGDGRIVALMPQA